MKFSKPSEKTGKETIAVAGGTFVGALASRAAFGFIHKPDATTDAAQIKKNENAALLKRGGMAVAGAVLAMAVPGNDSVSLIAKGVGYGITLVQGLEVVKTLSERNGVASEAAATTTGKKALARMVGLGCPCDGTTGALNGRGLRYTPYYAESNMDTYAETQNLISANDPLAALAV